MSEVLLFVSWCGMLCVPGPSLVERSGKEASNLFDKLRSAEPERLQGYLAHKKQRPLRTLQQDYA